MMIVQSFSVEKTGFNLLELIPHSENMHKFFVRKPLFLPLAISYWLCGDVDTKTCLLQHICISGSNVSIFYLVY